MCKAHKSLLCRPTIPVRNPTVLRHSCPPRTSDLKIPINDQHPSASSQKRDYKVRHSVEVHQCSVGQAFSTFVTPQSKCILADLSSTYPGESFFCYSENAFARKSGHGLFELSIKSSNLSCKTLALAKGFQFMSLDYTWL